MRLLLLGANGQLGVDITSHFDTKESANFSLQKLTRADLDISNVDDIVPTLTQYDFDVLINCTSYHKTDEVEANSNLATTINGHAVREMAKACAEKSARFIHISTDYVFGGNIESAPLNEIARPAPVNVYGASKVLGESLAQRHHDDTLVLRVASLFGIAGASGKGGNFVETMIRFGKEKGYLRVINDQHMTPTATADIAWMIFELLKAKVPAGVYHTVNSGQATWYEFACEIIKQAGIECTVDPIPSSEYILPAMRPPYSVLDNSKLSKQIGKIPHWKDALARYLEAKGHITETAS